MSDTLSVVERPDGTITNDNGGDPAVQRILGHRRYWVSADLGQANDFSAVAVIEDWTSSLFPDSLVIDPMRPFSKSYC